MVKSSNPVRLLPPTPAQGRNRETISSTPPAPVISCPGPGFFSVILPLLDSVFLAANSRGTLPPLVQRLGSRPISREEQLDRQLRGGHLERGVEAREHAEEGQLAAVGSAHLDRAEHLAACDFRRGIVLGLWHGVAGDLFDQSS